MAAAGETAAAGGRLLAAMSTAKVTLRRHFKAFALVDKHKTSRGVGATGFEAGFIRLCGVLLWQAKAPPHHIAVMHHVVDGPPALPHPLVLLRASQTIAPPPRPEYGQKFLAVRW